MGALAAFAYRPDHQRLAAAHVAGGEHTGNARHVIGAGCHVVFVTAYDEYAVAAFDEGAVDDVAVASGRGSA